MAKKKNNNEQKFKHTEYAKKLTKKVVIWFMIFFATICISTIIKYKIKNDLIFEITYLLEWATLTITIFYEGKIWGASEVYNKKIK